MPPLRNAELLARTPRAWGLGPRPCQGLRTLSGLSEINGCLCLAKSPDHVIDTEHINQLSRFHAQNFQFSIFVRFDQSIIRFWQKVVCEKLPCQNFVCDTQIQIPRLLGGFLHEAFPLAYDYTCTTSFLARVLRHNMHHIDLSDLQVGLPRSCVYLYVPDCSARE